MISNHVSDSGKSNAPQATSMETCEFNKLYLNKERQNIILSIVFIALIIWLFNHGNYFINFDIAWIKYFV